MSLDDAIIHCNLKHKLYSKLGHNAVAEQYYIMAYKLIILKNKKRFSEVTNVWKK